MVTQMESLIEKNYINFESFEEIIKTEKFTSVESCDEESKGADRSKLDLMHIVSPNSQHLSLN